MESILTLNTSNIEKCVPMYCAAFNRAPWNDGWNEDAALERLSTFTKFPNFHGLALTQNEIPVAMVLGWGERFTDGWTFLIKEMCVEPTHQRTGMGRKLFEHFEKSLIKKQYDSAYLETLEDGPSVEFYASLHYKNIALVMMKKRLR